MSSTKHVPASRPATDASLAPVPPPDAPVDRLSPLLDRFRVRAHLFHAGPLCGVTRFDAQPGRAFLHVMSRGELRLTHGRGHGVPQRLSIREPSLLFYPRPLGHAFHTAQADGADFACATLDFDGGDRHPLVAALPALVVVPLAAIDGLRPALDLLFDETERLRCGSRLLADRLFEVVLIQLLRWMLDRPDDAGIPRGLLLGLADPRLARALVAMHRSPGDPWPLHRMAAEAAMSRSAFAEAFREATGSTPAEHLADWRLVVATSALRAGRSIKEVAPEVGYASASALSKAFRQRMGLSPRDWLNAART